MAKWAIVLHGKVIKRFTLGEGERISIGRGSEADVVVDNTAISRKHTSMELRDGVHYVSDLGSLNGTFVNGARIDSPVPVSKEDTVDIGKFRLVPDEDPEQEEADSFSMSMDIDDETVFVTGRQSSAPRILEKGEKPAHSLTLVNGKGSPRTLSLDGRTSIKIGKDQSCDIIIPGWFVAGAQCYVIRRDGAYYIVPRRSWTATILNNTKIKKEHVLRKGDIIDIRSTTIRFE